jgi:hypothetical protein
MKIKISYFFFLLGILPILGGCGSNNLFDCSSGKTSSSCAKLTKDEEARVALDRGDMTTAVTILTELIESEPEAYERYPLLGAAYAGKAGLDLFNIVTANFGEGSSLLQVMESFVPSPTDFGESYNESLSDMAASVSTLLAIPLDRRSSTSSDKYSSSAALQLTLYQAAYGVMYLNKFTYGIDGYDPALLSTMTAEDAAIILNAFLGAAQAASGDAADSASTAISAIQAQPGSTDLEKLAAWSQTGR